jgi:hypothetical protein
VRGKTSGLRPLGFDRLRTSEYSDVAPQRLTGWRWRFAIKGKYGS